MQPGSVAFIPGWIMLLILTLTIAVLFPKLFKHKKTEIISPTLLAFILGTLMPAFDDLFAFIFGPPFAHHSLFHSLIGILVTYLVFMLVSTPKIAKYAAIGNLTHIVFNYYLDITTLFFPITYQEFGLTHIIKVNTYWIKAIHYPVILIAFLFATFKYLHFFKKS